MRTKRFRAVAVCVVAAALAASCAPASKKRGPTPYDKTVVGDCYTVDLFTVAKIEEPSAEVPVAWAK